MVTGKQRPFSIGSLALDGSRTSGRSLPGYFALEVPPKRPSSVEEQPPIKDDFEFEYLFFVLQPFSRGQIGRAVKRSRGSRFFGSSSVGKWCWRQTLVLCYAPSVRSEKTQQGERNYGSSNRRHGRRSATTSP